jgi:YXWGXW repeat-containing protein
MRNLSVRSLFFALIMLAIPAASSAQIILSIGFAPPPLPVYEQPICPSEGYIWTPGYWAYAQEGYFWVPGTWEMAPEPGLLWTPGYWGWGDNAFVFNEGYWGAQIGFYGGINYGFGYTGVGYQGGYWNNGAFFYNRSVNNVTNVTNVYNKTVIVNNREDNVSYNGGSGGVSARPSAEEEKATSEKHVARTSAQVQHVQTASTNHELYESVNHGKPAIAATAKPGEFAGAGVVAAKAAAPSYKPVTARAAAPAAADKAAARPATATHASELKPAERPAPNTGNPQLDKKYTQQQTKLNTSQAQERQQLQQKQEQDHQQLTKTKASDATTQKVEQKHQQQTQQVAQKHEAQQQKLQAKQQPAAKRAPPAKPIAEKKEN